MKEPNFLFVISGPSGAGKGTLCSCFLKEMPNMKYSVSATTRLPRPGEVNGKDYVFMTKEEFFLKAEQGEFLEWALVYGNYYGTPKEEVERCLKNGRDVILEIDIDGALQIKKKFPEGVFVFILPPSLKELEKRIKGRNKDAADVINRRLKEAVRELRYVSHYDYIVINDRVEKAVEKLKAIVLAEKCKSSRLDLQKNLLEE